MLSKEIKVIVSYNSDLDTIDLQDALSDGSNIVLGLDEFQDFFNNDCHEDILAVDGTAYSSLDRNNAWYIRFFVIEQRVFDNKKYIKKYPSNKTI